MNKNDFAHRILVNLARQMKLGEILDRKKLSDKIIAECFPEKIEDEQIWRDRIDKRLDFLLQHSRQEESEPLLVHLLEESCEECSVEKRPCVHACPTGAITYDRHGKGSINTALCVECGWCVDTCISGVIIARSEFAQVATMLLQSKVNPVYAILAPSFVGQFGPGVTPEILKAALKALGFSGVYEVAMAADIVVLEEAREFCERMKSREKFMITSCCCPAFIKLVEKVRPKVAHLISPSLSPMIIMGKMLKEREEECRVVFIGPCIAKKAEAKRPDLQPAVDCVLTFKETKALLEAAELSLDGSLGQREMEDASHDGRIFAHTGGVSEAIHRAVQRRAPDLEFRPVKGNGLKQCSELLKQLEEGRLDANFMEGMGCPEGCVGGPGTNIKAAEAAVLVREFADRAPKQQSDDNIFALQWMKEYYKAADTESIKLDM
jgi:iron only hydrogenase large subunit-like protein